MASAAETVPNTPFHLLGGHDTFQAIVDRFYDLMDSDPAYAELRAMHAEDLSRMRVELTRFLTGWAGGPRDWFDANPGRCMMSVHKPYAISQIVADQWADAMTRAIAEVAPARSDLAGQLTQLLGDMARGMGR